MAKINSLPAASYAKPHGVAAKKVTVKDPNTLAADKMTNETATPRVSAGNPAREDVKTTGIETRGNGAATKGRIARGPMA